jgi:flagellar assembly protein FliH
MFLSDHLPEDNSQWHPLDPEKVAGSTPPPDADGGFYEISKLYEAPDTESTASTFMPLYGSQKEQQPQSGQNADPEQSLEGAEPVPDPEEIRKKAYEEGFAEGETKGFAAGKEDADVLVNRMQSLLTEMEGIWKQLVETYEQQMIQLICKASEKAVFGHVDMDHEVIKGAILNAFQMIPEPVEVTIEVNSEDAEYIETVKEDFFSHVKTLKHISVIMNPSVTRGGCNVKTRLGEVDATLESRLEAIREAVIHVGKNKGKNGHSVES